MNPADLIAALHLPDGARVDQRVPKKLLVEYGAPSAADKRRINHGIEDVHWVAALKPNTIGVPAFRDEVREYLEIAVLSTAMRPDAKAGRLAELIHRAVPYPVFLIATNDERLALSLAHKRRSRGEAAATVLDGELVVAEFALMEPGALDGAFEASLALNRQPRAHLFALYQGWMDTLVSLLAARLTGAFTNPASPEQTAARHEALRECARLDAEIARLRVAAVKERQVARQIELNLELKRVERQRLAARLRL